MKRGAKANKLDKAVIHTKVGKYFMAVQSGKTKKESQIIAGYKTDTHATSIERTDTFQALTHHFKDSFSAKMSMDEISDYLIDNIKQIGAERVNREARNTAIKIVLDKLEPAGQAQPGEGDNTIIILSK